MMSMVGVEFTNFMNPNLTWKTVSKGSRSASRRPRKLEARNLKMVLDQVDNNSRTEHLSASESEKLGTTVIGRHLGDQIEHVPIKKRKFLFRSPSPPPRPPSQPQEATEKLVNSGSASGQCPSSTSVSKQQAVSIDASTDIKFSDCVDDGVVNGKISEMAKGKLGYSEDFSGIEMLVAVACNDSMADGGDTAVDRVATDDLLEKGIASSSSSVPLKESVSITGNSVHEDNLSLPTLPTSRDDIAEEKSVSLHVDRAHWDLNTDMDAWGHPCANLVVDSQTNVVDTVSEDAVGYENIEKVEGCTMLNDSGDVAETTIQFMVEKGVSTDAEGGMHVLPDSGNLTLGPSILNKDESKFSSSLDQTCASKKHIATSVEPALASSVFTAYAQTSTQVVSTDSCIDLPSCAVSNFMTAALTSEEIGNSAPSSDIIRQSVDCVSGMHLSKTVSLETTIAEKHNFDLTHGPGPEKTTSGCIIKQEFDDSRFTSHLHDNKVLQRLNTDKCGSPVCDGLNIENPGNKSGKIKSIHEHTIKQEFDDSGVTTHLLDNEVFPSLSANKCQSPVFDALAIENQGSKSGKIMNISLPSLMGEDLSASVASVKEEQPRVTDVAPAHDDKALGADRAEVDSPASCGQNELVENSYGYSTDTIGDGCGSTSEQCRTYVNDSPHLLGKVLKVLDSDELQDDQDHIVGMENTPEIQEGYDSQFEDGELRESLVPCLKDIEAEDGEAEQVDYESDDRDMYDINDGDHIVSFESNMRETSSQACSGGSLATNLDGEPRKRHSAKLSKLPLRTGTTRKDGLENPDLFMEVHRGGSADANEKNEHASGGDAFKDPSQSESSKSKCSAWDQQPDVVVSSSMTKQIGNSCMRRNQLNGCRDGSDAKDVSTRVVGLRESGRGKPLHGEGPTSFNLLRRNRTARLQQRRSNECDDLCAEDVRGPCGSDRAMGRMRSSLHMHGRGRGGPLDHRLGLWNSKHHQFRSYDGPYDSRKPRPKSIVINSDSKADDAGLSIYPPSKGVYRPFVRRSPTRRDDDYHLHRVIPARDISPDCMRGRSGRYHQRLSPKEGYFRSLPNDSDESFVRMPHNLARRDRSFSPMFPRGDVRFPHSNQRYRSRSRSHSPIMRQLPRDRNTGSRPLSRSPDFRSEARMERMRLPIRKPGFESDYEVDFMSPPRRHFSPKRNPRWIDDRNHAVDDFRNRRSPVRLFEPSRRLNSPGSPGRLKPDEYFRPAMRAGRFPNMACASRGHRDGDGDDYRRKPDSRYQVFNSMRRYGTDGGVRRFQYDGDGFVGHDSNDKDDCISDIEKKHRDMPRGAKERSFNMWP